MTIYIKKKTLAFFMDIFTEYEKLRQSREFRHFENANSEFYLVHVYKMIGADDATSLEFGFYNKNTDKIVVFETNPSRQRPEEDVFKEADIIHPLDLSTVHISMNEAISIAEKTCREKYPTEIISKKIVLLQNIDAQMWNITLISMSFNIINIRIDSATGEVFSTTIHSIMGLGSRL